MVTKKTNKKEMTQKDFDRAELIHNMRKHTTDFLEGLKEREEREYKKKLTIVNFLAKIEYQKEKSKVLRLLLGVGYLFTLFGILFHRLDLMFMAMLTFLGGLIINNLS